MGTIIRRVTAKEQKKRYASAEELKQALEQELKRLYQQKAKETHLTYHIAVAGAKRGIGTTHIAISFIAYLNQIGYYAVYQSMNNTDIVKLLHRNYDVKESCDGSFTGGNFRGILKEEALEHAEIQKKAGIYVMDFGSNLIECTAEAADCTILIIGGSSWEIECSIEAFQQLKHTTALIVICNYNHRQICRKYAADLGKKVYCYPFDENPFVMNKKKKCLFEEMLRDKLIFLQKQKEHENEGRKRISFGKWREHSSDVSE